MILLNCDVLGSAAKLWATVHRYPVQPSCWELSSKIYYLNRSIAGVAVIQNIGFNSSITQ